MCNRFDTFLIRVSILEMCLVNGMGRESRDMTNWVKSMYVCPNQKQNHSINSSDIKIIQNNTSNNIIEDCTSERPMKTKV